MNDFKTTQFKTSYTHAWSYVYIDELKAWRILQTGRISGEEKWSEHAYDSKADAARAYDRGEVKFVDVKS